MDKLTPNMLSLGVSGLLLVLALLLRSVFFDKICILILLLLFLVSGYKSVYKLNPYIFFVPAPLSLLLYSNVGDFYMLNLYHKTYFIAVLNMTVFYVALRLTIGSISKKRHRGLKIKSDFLSLVLLYLAGKILGLVDALQSVTWLLVVIAVVGIMIKNYAFGIVLVLIDLMLEFHSLSKTALLFYVILALIVGYSTGYFSRFSIRKRLALLSSISLGLLSSFNVVTKGNGAHVLSTVMDYYRNNGVRWDYFDELFLPYMYFVTPWSNLQYVLETNYAKSWGGWMAKPILGYFGIFDSYISTLELNAYSSFNTYTFIAVHFVDFGYFGSIIPTIVVGVLSGVIYVRFRINPNLLSLSLYITWLVAIFQMFFSNHFFQLSYPITMIFIVGFLYVLKSRFVAHDC